MRFCGAFGQFYQLCRSEERAQPDADARKRVRPALLTVDHHDRRADLETGLAQRLDRLDRGACRGDDVLDEAHPLARLEGALESIGGALLLSLLAHSQG